MRVLDASAVFRAQNDLSDGEYIMAPAVLDEIQKGLSYEAVDSAIKTGYLRITAPEEEYLKAVDSAAEKTGDSDWLSSADTESLALALEHKCPILTDDYGIQNVAEELGVKYETVTAEGITEQRRWVKRCEGCGKTFPPGPEKTCEICGSQLKKKKAANNQEKPHHNPDTTKKKFV